MGLGETDSWEKPEAKNLWHCPFKHALISVLEDDMLREAERGKDAHKN